MKMHSTTPVIRKMHIKLHLTLTAPRIGTLSETPARAGKDVEELELSHVPVETYIGLASLIIGSSLCFAIISTNVLAIPLLQPMSKSHE